MRRKLFVSLLTAVMIIAAFISGCGGQSPIQLTTTPAPSSPVQNTPKPSETATSKVSPLPIVSEAPLLSGKITDKTFLADIDNDGTEETITITSIEYGDPDDPITLEVSGKSGSYNIDAGSGWYDSSFLTKTGSGETCLIINTVCVGVNSDIYSFDGIQPVHHAYVDQVTDVSGMDITAEGYIDALGTWKYSRCYTLEDDFTLNPVSDFKILMEDSGPLHITKELPVEMLEDSVYIKKTLDIDTYIYPKSTDGKTYMKFTLENGSEGKINFIRLSNEVYWSGTYCLNNGPFIIDGINEYEYFDNDEYGDPY